MNNNDENNVAMQEVILQLRSEVLGLRASMESARQESLNEMRAMHEAYARELTKVQEEASGARTPAGVRLAEPRMASVPRGMKPPNPEYYDGSLDAINLNRWINQLDDYLNFYGHGGSSNDAARMAAFYLKSHAATWWTQFNGMAKAMITWDQLKMELKARFYPIDHERQVLSKLEKLTQRGPVAKYIEAFEALRSQLSDIADATIKRYFVNGLRADLRVKAVEFLLDRPDTTLGDMYQRLTAIGEVIWESRTRGLGSSKPAPMDLSALHAKSHENQDAKPGDRTMRKSAPRDMSKIQCYKCQKFGHFKRNCTSSGF